MGSRNVKGVQYRRILAHLAAARQAAGITQIELAALVGSNQSHVSKLERGERILDVLQFAELCRALKLDPRAVLQPILDRPARRKRKPA